MTATAETPVVRFVAVEELQPGDRLAMFRRGPRYAMAAHAAAQALIDAATRANIYNRPGVRDVRRILFRGRTVEITTEAYSTATAVRGTVVAVYRRTA